LVEVLVASALMAVALVVLLGSLSSLLVGSRVAEHRTVEERLARNQIESLMAQEGSCFVPSPSPKVDGVVYSVEASCHAVPGAGYEELTVTVHPTNDPAGHSLRIDRVLK
jgi:type II secretory pathway pseudopilin PulG